MAEPIRIASVDNHEAIDALVTIAAAVGPLALRASEEKDPARRLRALEQVDLIAGAVRVLHKDFGGDEVGRGGFGCDEEGAWRLLMAGTRVSEADVSFSDTTPRQVPVRLMDSLSIDAPIASGAVTLGQIREQKILRALRAAGEDGATVIELGSALNEPQMNVKTLRVIVSRALGGLKKSGVNIVNVGTHKQYRHKLVETDVPHIEDTVTLAGAGPSSVAEQDVAEKRPYEKLTRWGLERGDDEFFVDGSPLELDPAAHRLLGLLVERPAGFNMVLLRRVLQQEKLITGDSPYDIEFDFRGVIGRVQEQVGGKSERPRIYEHRIFTGRKLVWLLMLQGRIAQLPRG